MFLKKIKAARNVLGGIGLACSLLPTAFAGLENGSFENPYVPDSSYSLFSPSLVPGWKTTDSAIEIWGDGFSSLTPAPVYAYDGRQFAEINAYNFGTLYQDITSISAGSIVGFQFAHRGRSGIDTMALIITDLGSDNLFGTSDDTTLFTKNYSDGTTDWGFYTSATENAIYALGNTIRFGYQAVTTASGSSSIGNFLDAADFGVGIGGCNSCTVPEPATLGLIGLGLAGLAFSRRRKT